MQKALENGKQLMWTKWILSRHVLKLKQYYCKGSYFNAIMEGWKQLPKSTSNYWFWIWGWANWSLVVDSHGYFCRCSGCFVLLSRFLRCVSWRRQLEVNIGLLVRTTPTCSAQAYWFLALWSVAMLNFKMLVLSIISRCWHFLIVVNLSKQVFFFNDN